MDNRGINALGEGDEVCVEGADNNASMCGLLSVQTNEVLAIECHQRPAGHTGEAQHLGIGHGLSGPSSLCECQHIVTKAAQLVDCGTGKVLVGIEQSQC